MASVETTTIRVRRSTHKRLQEEAELPGDERVHCVEAGDVPGRGRAGVEPPAEREEL